MADQTECFPQSPEQLKTFLGMHLNRLTHHACYVLGDRDDAEDVVQETVIRAYCMREKLKTVRNPLAYLFRMVSNAALDRRRRTRTRQNTETAMKPSAGSDFIQSREELLIREEENEWIRSLLHMLPEEQAVVIRFRFADELSFAEIAQIVEAPLATVKSRFLYGMVKLRSMVNKQKEVPHEM